MVAGSLAGAQIVERLADATKVALKGQLLLQHLLLVVLSMDQTAELEEELEEGEATLRSHCHYY